ncbi:MAG: cell wall hydrolase, partial [Novosphingobium sp.]
MRTCTTIDGNPADQGAPRPPVAVQTSPGAGVRQAGIVLVLLAFAVLALAYLGQGRPRDRAGAEPRTPAVSSAPGDGPVVEPQKLLPVSPEGARAINAAVPFAAAPLIAAAPFRLPAAGADRAAATACLAAAVLYEAGDDRAGQAAVAQVVLNRVRHPSFPKSVCGVVFQGSSRSTGCQFSFTCDGSLRRTYPPATWRRAEAAAALALAGAVDPSVGLATHYHTDWVVPVWSARLDKIARVGTHLFFRWPGTWGAARAFRGRYAAAETIDARLLPHFAGSPLLALAGAQAAPDIALAASPSPPPSGSAMPGVDLRGASVLLADEGAGVFVLRLPPGRPADDHALASRDLCHGRAHCTVLGYLPADDTPRALPLPTGAARRASFFFDSSVARGFWNCSRIPRPRASECIAGTASALTARARP